MSKTFPCCLALIALLGAACSEDKVTVPPSEEPVVVSDLGAARTSNRHVALYWTAPGPRGAEHPSRYDVRRSSNSIEESTWNEATVVDSTLVAGDEGRVEGLVDSDLPDGEWFFALRVILDTGVRSPVSNVVSVAIVDTVAPGRVTDLRAVSRTDHSITLGWTATGNDNTNGTATSYDLRFSTQPIEELNWQDLDGVAGVPTPAAAGSAELVTVPELQSNTTYHFALKAMDGGGNVSPLSNVATETTTFSAPSEWRVTFSSPPGEGAGWPVWLPGGDGLVFHADWATGFQQVYRISLDGGDAEQLTRVPRGAYGSSLSSDGRRVAFLARPDVGVNEVWVMDLDPDAQPRRVASLVGGSQWPIDWSPDDQWIAYGDQVDGRMEIFAVNVETGVSVPVAGDLEGGAFGPAWSPDGTEIAYCDNRSGQSNIWIKPFAGGESRQLTAGGQDTYPSWSPDGTRIMYSHYHDGVGKLWVIPAEGGTPEQITDGPGFAWDPAWSPDGSSIAYTITTDHVKDVWIMQLR